MKMLFLTIKGPLIALSVVFEINTSQALINFFVFEILYFTNNLIYNFYGVFLMNYFEILNDYIFSDKTTRANKLLN